MIERTISHYHIISELGAGSMGVVYKAEDTRLRRHVALKFLPAELTGDAEAKARFVREARSASSLDHPNICTVYEIDETPDGRLFIAMACYEGETLANRLAKRPLEVEEAVGIAEQAARGLAEAHAKGIVHRDVKPANIFVTDNGLIKLLDFGVAKLTDRSRLTRAQSMVGTVTYMSPEQVRGEDVDHRADIWSVGVVLYESLTGRLPFAGDQAHTMIYSILESPPTPLRQLEPAVPERLAEIVHRCLQKPAVKRFRETKDLLSELAETREQLSTGLSRSGRSVVRSLVARSSVRPYPGLAAFTEAEAGFFYGREVEIEEMWQRLQHQTLLALIGPSGAGKTSLLRAGLIPLRPTGWGCVICTPGGSPFVSLRQALVPELAGDTEAIQKLLETETDDSLVEAALRWRARHTQALLILDQFEELFTLSDPEVQGRFAAVLGRLREEADIRVVVSLRDDFFMHCHEHPALGGVFEAVLPVGPLKGEALRRALVRPALDCDYRFGDESFVEDMLQEVAGERGALPLLAFAVSRLWDKRDHERRLLTRAAYEEIGGVGGALAQHAEATLERIGTSQQGIVREIFRNLVTAQGTRAVRPRAELLSVFPAGERAAAAEILRNLIRARLLTSYEIQAERAGSEQQIEIIHESLLTHWPRLVRWQTQDADAAQLRDQLRRSARMWSDRGRPEDLLWQGTSYQEYVVWRSRYPGGLTDVEQAYAAAMTELAGRRRRRRRLAVTAAFVILLVIVAAGGVLWRRSEAARGQAVAEARRAEAGKLLVLGQSRLAECPTEAAAYALASLELADRPETRRLASKALGAGPTLFHLPQLADWNPWAIDFSPDGRWFAVGWSRVGGVWIYPTAGGPPRQLVGHSLWVLQTVFGPRSDMLVTTATDSTIRVWSIPDGELLQTFEVGAPTEVFIRPDGRSLVSCSIEVGKPHVWKSWTLEGGEPVYLGSTGEPVSSMMESVYYSHYPGVDPTGTWIADWLGKEVYIYPVQRLQADRGQRIGSHPAPVVGVRFDESGRRLATFDSANEVRIWSLPPAKIELLWTFQLPGDIMNCRFDASGEVFACALFSGALHRWQLSDSFSAEYKTLRGRSPQIFKVAFDPLGRWIATTGDAGAPSIWPVEESRDRIVQIDRDAISSLHFTPSGDSLLYVSGDKIVIQKFPPTRGAEFTKIHGVDGQKLQDASVDWAARRIAYADGDGGVWIAALDGGPPRRLEGFAGSVTNCVLGPGGRYVAAQGDPINKENFPIVWDLSTGRTQRFDALEPRCFRPIDFTPDGEFLALGEGCLVKWNLEGLTSEILLDGLIGTSWPLVMLTNDFQRVFFVAENRDLVMADLASGEQYRAPSGTSGLVHRADLSEDGWSVALASTDGSVIYWDVRRGSVHHLFGHDGILTTVNLDPSGNWIVTTSRDHTMRLWSIPAGRPLESLPYGDLLDRLRNVTNLRVVADPDNLNGFRMDLEPIEGWEYITTRTR